MTSRALAWSCLLAATLILGTGCAAKGLQARMANGERRAGDADNLLDEADKALNELEPERANDLLNDARQALKDPDVEYYPERNLLQMRVASTEIRVDAVRVEKARKELEEAVAKQQKDIDEVVARVKPTFDPLKRPEVDKGQVSDARKLAEDLQDLLNEGRPLEKKSPSYQAWAKDRWELLEKRALELKMAEALMRFKEGPYEDAQDGKRILTDARKAPRDDRQDMAKEAREKFVACQLEGKELLAKSPGLESLLFAGEKGKKQTPTSVIQSCGTQVASADKLYAASKPRAPSKPTVKKKKR
jgi:hypothetical protein